MSQASYVVRSSDSESTPFIPAKQGLQNDDKYEDNLPMPSRYAMIFLKGRTLHGCNRQDFSAEWIFQRFVNVAMQPLTTRWHEMEGEGWYYVRVEGQQLQQLFPSGMVVAMAAVLSPFLFPLVFGASLLGLTLFSPYTVWCYLRSFRKNTLIRKKGVEVGGKWRGPSKEMEKEFDESSETEARFSYWSICVTIIACAWYFTCGVVPWFLLFSGKYACIVDPMCEDSIVHTSPLTVFGMWLGCAIAAFRFVHNIHVSSCDCACEAENSRMLRDRTFGKAMHQMVHTLADNKDEKRSFWPIFVKSEDDEPEKNWSCFRTSLVILGPLLHGVLPQIYMSYTYSEPLLPVKEDWVIMSVIGLGVIAPAIEMGYFLYTFVDAIVEFEDVAKQLLIFSCISSKLSMRKRAMRFNAFKKVISDNDKYRQQHGFEDKTRFDDKRTETRWSNDELCDLSLFRVSFNFSRREGVMLYRKMRQWLSTDVLNERMEIEWYVSISIAICVVSTAVLAIGYFATGKPSAVWTVLPWDIMIMAYLILRSLNLCVVANEYLFDDASRALLDWLDEIGQPEAYFETSPDKKHELRQPAIGWVFDEKEQREKALPLCNVHDGAEVTLDAADDKSLDKAKQILDNTIRRIELLEEKQKILGLEVTRALRNRLAASLFSVIVAMASKIPDLLKEHSENINFAIQRAQAFKDHIV
eukprot:gb/GFBE01033512.1/.p1 GENE.gb/GFBE01033512.1/~~gb/GFBE01033512.1/.p1  ORF type:complete len:694 (+),score=125.29 gb/GFBE01033512.1/:1-2082(+)